MTRRRQLDARAGLGLLAPALVALAALAAWPGVWVLWLSLQKRIPIFGVDHFVGVAHYGFLGGDARFWNAARVTLVFTVVSVLLELALGVAVALALQRQQRARRLTMALLLLPWALPSVVVGRTFEWLYHPSAGLVNFVLGGRAINWLGEPALALPALIVADVWRTMPFVALLFRTLDALRAFDLMFVLTGGGPANTTETLTVYAYRSLFQTLQLGLGAAVGVVVFALVMLVAWSYLRAVARSEASA